MDCILLVWVGDAKVKVVCINFLLNLGQSLHDFRPGVCSTWHVAGCCNTPCSSHFVVGVLVSFLCDEEKERGRGEEEWKGWRGV
jgi:hypothetical protein